MKDLVGKECIVDFDLPDLKWPIQGYPAKAIILDLWKQMIKMKNPNNGDVFWINVNKIYRIWEV